jgi:hypothetical protein
VFGVQGQCGVVSEELVGFGGCSLAKAGPISVKLRNKVLSKLIQVCIEDCEDEKNGEEICHFLYCPVVAGNDKEALIQHFLNR